MTRILTMMALACTALACGEGADDREARTPESYVPEDVREQAQALEPLARACVEHLYILEARADECGGGRWGGAAVETAIEACRDGIDAARVDSPAYVDILQNCLDRFAGAPCAALEGDGLCDMVPEW